MCTVGMFVGLFGDPCLFLHVPVVALCVQQHTCGGAFCQIWGPTLHTSISRRSRLGNHNDP